MAEKEIKEVNQQYSILKISDSINGIITNIYKPSNFRYDGKTLFFTLNNSLDMHLFTKLDLSNTYDLFLDVCINDSLFKHPNSDTLWVFKKNTNERLFWVVDEK
jgi:hypothetical protein